MDFKFICIIYSGVHPTLFPTHNSRLQVPKGKLAASQKYALLCRYSFVQNNVMCTLRDNIATSINHWPTIRGCTLLALLVHNIPLLNKYALQFSLNVYIALYTLIYCILPW